MSNIANDIINDLNNYAGYIKDKKQIEFDSREDLFRIKFNKCVESVNDVINAVESYIVNIPADLKSSYDKIEVINFSKDLTWPKELKERSLLDYIDYARYMYYYRNDSFGSKDILNIIFNNKIHDEDFVRLDGITYIWNCRKEEFNKLRHKLNLYDAVTILQSEIKLEIPQKNNKVLLFSVADLGEGRKYFSVVEIEISEEHIRIINCRRSSEREMLKEKKKYDNNK